jgi:hypothetical protein
VLTSATFHSEARTLRAPAYWNARVRPSMPSPDISLPRPVPQAESVTSSASMRTCSKISQACSRPLSWPACQCFGTERAREESRGEAASAMPWQAKWMSEAPLPTALACPSVAAAPRYVRDDPA